MKSDISGVLIRFIGWKIVISKKKRWLYVF